MGQKRWRIAAVAAVLCGVVAVPFLRQAAADTTVPDGGGWPGAGAPATARVRPLSAAPAGYPVRGVDVSSHDHSVHAIDWPAVARTGVSFAYIKATEGTSYQNPYFGTDYAAARNAGLYVGAYAYGRPDLGNPAGQADYFVSQSLWGPDSRSLVPFLDIEWPYGAVHKPACWGLTPAQMSGWIRAFLTEVRARIGRNPMIYTNAHWWNPCTGNDASFGGYPLDISGYSGPPALPAGWSTFAIWQYAAGDNNAAGNYDKDVVNGDLNALAALGGPSAPTAVGLLAHANGRYVTADRAGAGPLVANRMSIGTWEQFALVHGGDGSVSLRARINGRYVSADRAGAGPLVANRMSIGTWERFDAVPAPRVVSLRAHANGRYVCADRAGAAPLIANRTAVGTWEQFDLLDLGGGRVALRAHADGLDVSADRAGAAPLIADRPAVNAWETFTLVHNTDGSVSLRAHANGRYVTAEHRGTAPLVANRTAVGGWEEFDLG